VIHNPFEVRDESWSSTFFSVRALDSISHERNSLNIQAILFRLHSFDIDDRKYSYEYFVIEDIHQYLFSIDVDVDGEHFQDAFLFHHTLILPWNVDVSVR
jgi:hypothetical protein